MVHRLFLSIPIERHFADVFMRYADTESDLTYLRWTPARKLHITLLFVGPVPAERVPTVVDTVRAVVARHAPFSLELARVAYAPPKRPKEMVWAYWVITEALLDLRSALLEALRISAIATGDEYTADVTYLPHTTLARFRADIRQPNVHTLPRTTLEGRHMIVEDIHLLESRQTGNGSEYRTVATCPLVVPVP
jgi:2'-5' RNA ligase